MTNERDARAGQVHAIVPLKLIKKSKTRLSAISSQKRAKLTVAMLSNVLAALSKSRRISDITVVSSDRRAARIAHRYRANFLWEGRPRGLNRALKAAIRKLGQETGGTAIIVHADLPLLTPKDIDNLVSGSEGSQIAIVPCKNGTGTNALLLKPPDVIPPVFGNGSFKTHLSLARKTRLRCKVLRIWGIQFDIDDPRDLREFMRHNELDESFRFLRN
jgi:2-phospho-L-lactate guanylyltransferase